MVTSTEGGPVASSGLWRGSPALRLRLVSGLVLTTFAAAHFLNNALGLVSLDAMTEFDHWRTGVTRSAPGTLVLAAALLIHAGLGIWRVVQRRTLRLPAAEWLQIALGLAIPFLLLPHIVNTRVAAELFGVRTTYAYELAHIWPASFVTQSALLLIVWIHGCIGLHFWLRLSPRYGAIRPLLFGIAVLLPFAAVAGVSVQGRLLETALGDPAAMEALHRATNWPDDAAGDLTALLRLNAVLGYSLVVGGALVAAVAAAVVIGRRKRLMIQYVGGPQVRAEIGPTLLEISQRHKVPHVSVCGGRGRCSTCRVLVLSDGASLSPPDEAELRTLRAVGAGAHVRLACQARPIGAVTVLPLLKSTAATPQTAGPQAPAAGAERDLAVLFVDLRGFTALTESKLPFDVIYILNQFFATVGQPIADLGGWIANYAGDGVIALFSDETGIKAACRAALLAAAEIDRAMTGLNQRLAREIGRPLEIAMGLHAGPHVMGRVGFGSSQAMSVVGLAVNVASRLETLAKQEGAQLAFSGVVADHGGLDASGLRVEKIDIRGLREPLDVIFIAAARDLLARLGRNDAASGGDLDHAAFG